MKLVRVPFLQISTAMLLAMAVAACGPAAGGSDDDDDGTGVDAANNPNCANPVPEICNNGIDDDCDNIGDCDDADCSSDPACSNPNCGTLEEQAGSLVLPDGACPEDETLPCDGYESQLNFTGFSNGQTLNDVSKLLGVCVNMEHTWMRDLVIYAQCPNGTRVMLSDFEGHSGGEVLLGQPLPDDGPTPGVGWDYCWTPTATNLPWIPYANANNVGTLPAGDYQSSQPLTAFVGCPLNGNWTLRVEDRWGIDNGFIFNWSVKFDASIVEDCASWPG
ncbi:MAG: hypothetical protein IPL61_35880 [Myxococcales bacterium]|nr:hypothetical protein [Myxococcales bacterium]